MLQRFTAFLLSFVALSVVADSSDIGEVIIAKKKVEALRESKSIPLKRKDIVVKKDIVSTGEKARAQLRLSDGTLFTLGENTKLEINEYLFSEDENNSAIFNLTTGVFRAVTGKLTKISNPNFKVKTPLGVIGIRGTDFWGGFLDPENIDVILLSGEHPIVVENEFGRSVISELGTGVTIKPGQAPSQPYKWSDEKLGRAVETITIN